MADNKKAPKQCYELVNKYRTAKCHKCEKVKDCEYAEARTQRLMNGLLGKR